jgi:DNA-binding XRE family transcriptional regulator
MKTISQVRKKVTDREPTRIQILREEARLGVREAAGFSGISPATWSRVESGKAPDIRTAFRLAHFFETSIEDLFQNFK